MNHFIRYLRQFCKETDITIVNIIIFFALASALNLPKSSVNIFGQPLEYNSTIDAIYKFLISAYFTFPKAVDRIFGMQSAQPLTNFLYLVVSLGAIFAIINNPIASVENIFANSVEYLKNRVEF